MQGEIVVSSDGVKLAGRRNVSAWIQEREVLDRFHLALNSVLQWLQGQTLSEG